MNERLRKYFLQAARIGLITTCLAVESSSETPKVPISLPQSPAQATEEKSFILAQQELIRLHPELQDQPIRLRSSREIVSSKTPTIIFNYTNFDINYQAINEMYKTVEYIASFSARDQTIAFKYQIGGSERILMLFGRPLSKKRILAFIPKNIRVNAGDQIKPGSGGFTTPYPHQEVVTTFIRPGVSLGEDIAQGLENQATIATAVEVCQQVITPAVVDPKTNKLHIEELFIAQEVVCNSLGRGIASRMLDIPYERYKKNLLPFLVLEGTTEQVFLVTKEFYNLIKPKGRVIN